MIFLEDEKIIGLYNLRNEEAISETAAKYGKMLYKIAYNILSDNLDSEETVNDTYLRAWNSIPPEKPFAFGAWLGKITRNLSIGLWRKNNAKKRSGIETMFSELEECIPSKENTESEAENGEITSAVNRWLKKLPKEDRILFIRRYWYCDDVSLLAEKSGKKAGAVSSKIFRLRKSLRDYLEKEGINI